MAAPIPEPSALSVLGVGLAGPALAGPLAETAPDLIDTDRGEPEPITLPASTHPRRSTGGARMTFMARMAGAAALSAAILLGCGLLAPPAQSGYIATLTQTGDAASSQAEADRST